MGIIDNQGENKNNNKKKVIICTIIAAVAVIGGIAAAVGISGKKAQPAFADENVNGPAESLKDSADLTDDLKTEEELPEHEADMEEWTAVYTTENSDEESLIQLVKDTILSADHQFEQTVQENGESSRITVLLRSISDAGMDGADFDSLFIPADSGFILDSEMQSWSYWDVAGALGKCIFYQKDLESDDLFVGELLKHFVAYEVYGLNVDGIVNWKVEGLTDTVFPADIDFDVNFVVYFDNDDLHYAAIIGNLNGEYRVLDVIYAEEIDSVLVMKEVEPEEPETQPEIAPAYDEHDYSDDPYVGDPNYQGEIDGYIYVPGYGYVLDEGGGGYNPNPDRPLPDYEACVYDENGKCVLHEHRGSM